MNQGSEAIARWLEQKRRRDRASAAVIAVLALASGTAVFLLATLLVSVLLSVISGISFGESTPLLVLTASGFTAFFFARIMKSRRQHPDLDLDPLGFWIIKDLCSIGPRLILEGLHQVRCCGELGELNVAACARALAFLAARNAAVDREDLMQHCPQLSWERLSRQLLLLDGVLFLGEDASRITLMEPFRLLLRSMLGPEPRTARERPKPVRPKPGPAHAPAPETVPVNEPEKLSAYEILGLAASASMLEIKAAYRKRIKACHPDLFAGMDPRAIALAERWTKALNAAYASLNPRQRGAKRNPTH